MFLTVFLTVALIPALVVDGTTASSEVMTRDHHLHRQQNSRSLLNSRRLELPQYSPFSEEYFWNDEFFQRRNEERPLNIRGEESLKVVNVKDPILREIYEEEMRLNLAGNEHDMRSEEARELISFQRRKLNAMANFARQAAAIIGVPKPAAVPSSPQGRSLQFGGNSRGEEEQSTEPITTEYTVMVPSSTTSQPEVEEVKISTSTITPVTGRMGIGGVFGKVGSAFSSVKHKIFGGGSSNTPVTSTTTLPPTSSSAGGNNVYFPEEDDDKQTAYRPRPTQQPGSAAGGPSSIVFGEEDGSTNPPTPPTVPQEPLNCTGFQTEYQEKCYNVLQPLPCPTGQWLIEDDLTGKGKCVEDKCAHKPNHAYFGGNCVVVRQEGEHCHKGMQTYIYKNGEVECDCKEGHLFNARDGNCYAAYRRGPCNAGEIFATKITEKGALPAGCMRSKCSKDGFFCNAPFCPNDRNCIALKSKCPTGQWDIHPEKLSPACIDFDVHKPDRIIGNVPTLQCAPGSRRDILGTCRKSSRITFS